LSTSAQQFNQIVKLPRAAVDAVNKDQYRSFVFRPYRYSVCFPSIANHPVDMSVFFRSHKRLLTCRYFFSTALPEAEFPQFFPARNASRRIS
jgi:hypothetical protein